jgi:NitT/TauT family transport system ATP-binding protein
MVKLENIAFSFEKRLILSDINANCDSGEFISFIGPSGCGKTTLLHLIAGIYKPQIGKILNTFDRVSFVFQNDSLLPWLNVLQNVLLPLEIEKGKVVLADTKKAISILTEVGLSDTERLYPSELSGGMRKRVELARALVVQPQLLILDEPFSSLDVINRERLNVLLKNLFINHKFSVILVTHSIEEAVFLSNRIYVMSDKPSSIISVFENKEARIPSRYFLLSEQQQLIESSIRLHVSENWQNLSENGHYKRYKAKNIQTGKAKIKIQENEPLNSKLKKSIYSILIPFELVFIFLLLEFLKKKLNIEDFFLPLPSSILKRFLETIQTGFILPHIFQTVLESLCGFIIAFILSLISGYLLSRSKFLYNLTMPYIIAFNTIPSVALIPFLILWFGFSIVPKIIISIIVMFFPMLITNITAFVQIQQQYKNLLIFYKPSAIERFKRFEFPGALAYIFSGVKVSITLSIIGAVVGEFQAGSVGLGSLILIAKANFDTPLMFVALLWLIILGITYFSLANFIYIIVTKRKKITKEN